MKTKVKIDRLEGKNTCLFDGFNVLYLVAIRLQEKDRDHVQDQETIRQEKEIIHNNLVEDHVQMIIVNQEREEEIEIIVQDHDHARDRDQDLFLQVVLLRLWKERHLISRRM